MPASVCSRFELPTSRKPPARSYLSKRFCRDLRTERQQIRSALFSVRPRGLLTWVWLMDDKYMRWHCGAGTGSDCAYQRISEPL